LIHEVTRAEKLADRRRAHSVDHAGLKVEEDSAGHVLAALGLRIIFEFKEEEEEEEEEEGGGGSLLQGGPVPVRDAPGLL
jgi:hypothetical protein